MNNLSSVKKQSSIHNKDYLICTVCGASAIGFNFSVLTCMCCKAFFRRNALLGLESLQCRYSTDKCTIDIKSRRDCSYCRLKKCFQVGMKKELIVSKDIKRLKRDKKILESREITSSTINRNEALDYSNEIQLQITNVQSIYDLYEKYCRSPLILFEKNECESLNQQPIKSRIKIQHYFRYLEKHETSLINFFQNLSELEQFPDDERILLIQHNLKFLIRISLIEIIDDQLPLWSGINLLLETMFGKLFMKQANDLLHKFKEDVNDSICIRLLLVILFFSTCEKYSGNINTVTIYQIHDKYTNQLWLYLMQIRNSGRLLLCIANILIFIACLHDLFVVKYRTDIHLVPRWVLVLALIFYIILFFFTRISPNLFSNVFVFSTSFLLSLCLSLSTFTLVTNTISSTTNYVLFNFLLILSIICSFLSNIINLLNNTTFNFIHYNELAELIGFSFGLYIIAQSTALYYLILSLFLIIITLRLRAFHGFILLLFNLGYFYNYYTPYSYIACFCFLVRLLGRPIIELYFISLTSLERWILLLHLSNSYRTLFQRFMILIYCLLPLHCIYVIAQTVRFHNEWFIIVPVFMISVGIWFIFRSLTCSLLWMLSNKLIDCYMSMLQANINDENHKISFTKLMASKGIRYFGLIAWPMIVCSTLLTCFISLLHYDTCTKYSIILFLLTIDFECLILAFVKQLTSIVGGSCVGYALVAPAFETRDTGLFSGSRSVQILSQQEAYETSQRCTNILNSMERFMASNLIDIFGCDYSSSGITMSFIDNKLKGLFARRTNDGRHYDTYFFYFSGPTCDNGDIILADNQKITLNLLFQWWCENESSSKSRLILVFDTFNSHQWIKQIRCQTFNNSCRPSFYMVLQTFNRQKKMPKLIELGQVHLGVFTEIWLKLNMTDETSKSSHDSNASWRANHLEPKCSFSYYYPEFNFRQPTDADVDTYLNEHLFLKRLHFIYHILTYIPSLFMYPFLCMFNCIKRWRFHLLAPRVIDTYHGFKLFVR